MLTRNTKQRDLQNLSITHTKCFSILFISMQQALYEGAHSFGTVEAPLMQCSEIHLAANRTTRRGTGYYCTVTVVYRSRSEEHCWLPLRYCNCKRTLLKRTVVRAMSCGCNSAANLLVQLHFMAFIVLATLNFWVDVRLAILLIVTQYNE